MSYLVLARKYRPKSFTEMVGQEHVVQALTNALTQQRLHHAYLFTGTRGVGKTTVSRILAKSLNCLGADGNGGITASPCGVCAACTAIDSGRFVDYTELDAASNRGVDEVQQLLEQAVYKPVQGRFKVFMIDEVHMLTNTAFNAMLKTLEEPPEYLKFVLATTDPQKVPVTVLSRCLQFSLRPMAPETVYAHLQSVLQTEKVQADDASLHLISRAARGSMRDALSLADQAIAFGAGALQEANVRNMLGAVDRSYVFKLIAALAAGDGKAVLETSETLRLNGLSAASTLEDMASVLQRMAVVQSVPDAFDNTDAEAVETARLASLMPADETQLLYSLCIHGRAELGLAPDEYAGLTMTLLRLLAFKPKGFKPGHVAAPAVVHTDTAAEKKTLNSAQPEPPTTPVPSAHTAVPVAANIAVAVAMDTAAAINVSEQNTPPAQQNRASAASNLVAIPIREQSPPTSKTEQRMAPVPPDAQQDAWVAVVQQLMDAETITALARELALQSQCVGRGDQHITLRVESASLNSESSRDKLQAAFAQLGRTELLRFELGPVVDSWAKRNTAKIEERQRMAQDLIEGDPFVQEMIENWGAKIVPGTVKAV
jgi:DNA polymerase III subunit gamma/tau